MAYVSCGLIIKAAETIVTAPSGPRVPSYIFALLEKTIRARECYPRQDGQKSKEDIHKYFLDSLRYIHSLLLPHVQRTASDHRSGPVQANRQYEPSDLPSKRIANPFATLTFDDLADVNEETVAPPLGSRPIQADANKIEIQIEEDDRQEEQMFALFCYLTDCHRLRQYLRETWRRYLKGDTSLAVVAVLTNTAFEIIRSLSTQLTLDDTQLESFPRIAELLAG